MKKHFLSIGLLFCFLFVFSLCTTAQTVYSFTASEIASGTTKTGITASSSYTSTNSKQICKENGSSKKADIIEVKNTASKLGEHYIEISSLTDIATITIHGSGNASGTTKIAVIMWGGSSSSQTATAEQLVTMVGNDGNCADNYTEINIPSGIKSVRLYRQIKKYDTTSHSVSNGSNYGDGKTFFVADIDVTLVETTPASTDATLAELKYDGTDVPGFDAGTTDYNVVLAANYTGVPAVTATANDTKATVSITPTTAVPGDASVLVRAEDGTTTKTYTIHFTKAAADEPCITSFVVGGVTATIDQANKTITAELPLGSSLTGLTPTVTGDNIGSYTPQGAQDFTNPVTYTVNNAANTKSATYTVTLTVEQPKSSDASLGSLTIGGQSITIVPGQTAYKVDAESGSVVPQVSATAADTKAKVVCIQATSLTSTATVTITAEDGTTQTYTISFNITVPKTDLTIHYPGVYEESSLKGGYDGALTVFGGREYEVYYMGKTNDSKATVNLMATEKVDGITDSNRKDTSCKAIDGWFSATLSGFSNFSGSKDEFVWGSVKSSMYKMQNGNSFKAHISGFDQFSIYAKDKKSDISKGRYFEIYIDGIKQANDKISDSETIRRYNLSTGEHLIEVKALGNESSELYGFSFRVADEPRVKYLSGNDTTQSVLVTRPMAPVTYYTKYNSKGTTKLEWDGTAPTGIALQKSGSDAIGDTLVLSGTPMCAAGVYPYRVVSYNLSNEATATLTGKITVATKIEAKTDTIQDGFTNEAIDGFEFQYYAESANDIKLTWDNIPAGISGLGNNGTYTISGTPTQAGTYKFTVTVAGGNTITGQLRVTVFDPGNNPVLYLYKNTNMYEKDGVYQYLKSQNFNLVPRKAQAGLREQTQYEKYTWVLISEDVDANNGEIMALARGQKISMPVLNMKSFSYSESRLDWGDPDNGSLNNKGVTVVQATHPIIKALGKKQGDKIEIISEVTGKGLMPAAVDYQGTLCIATATTRGEEYDGDGVEETFLHEVPATWRGGKKYICFPLSIQSSQRLTADGKKLLDACVDYLTNTASTIALPTLQITKLTIDDKSATIYQENDSIYLQMAEETDLTALTPTVTLADATTYYTIPMANEDGTVDFSSSNLLPVTIRVSDHINVRNYVVVVVAKQKEQTGIEEIYQTGDWMNIYDVQGRLVRTTNEDIRTLSLPKGMYIISTQRGTMKLMK